MSFSARYLMIAVGLTRLMSVEAMPKYFKAMAASPNLPYDPNTSPYCTWWVDYTGTQTCQSLLADNFITLTDFERWNPSITGAGCSGLKSGYSYCVEAYLEPPPTSTAKVSSTAPPTITSKATLAPTSTPAVPSSTKAPNGIQTPLPTQPNIVDNCDLFYLVKSGDGCSAIASQFGITLEKFLTWNPSAGSTCGGLWKDAYACVSIIGEAATSAPPPTSTAPPSGITTPLPTQPNIVSNCDAFHFVKSGVDNCQSLATQYSITLDQFLAWNPSAGTTCSGLWADAYACVSIIGVEPSPTSPPNGVTTPAPIQPGMVTNCKKFDFVNKGEGCNVLISRNNISLADFTKWNTGVGSDCTSMWAESYVCVGV